MQRLEIYECTCYKQAKELEVRCPVHYAIKGLRPLRRKQMTYTVAGELCDTRLKAIEAHIGCWFAMTSQDQMAKLDANEETDQFIAWYKEDDCGTLSAQVTGQLTQDGEFVYEDLDPTRQEILEIIEECIKEAVAND